MLKIKKRTSFRKIIIFLIATTCIVISLLLLVFKNGLFNKAKASGELASITGNSLQCATAEDNRITIRWDAVTNANQYYVRIKGVPGGDRFLIISGNYAIISSIIGSFSYSIQAKNTTLNLSGPESPNFSVQCFNPCDLTTTTVRSCGGCISCRRQETYKAPYTSDMVWCQKTSGTSVCARECADGSPITSASMCPAETPLANPTSAVVVGPTDTPTPTPTQVLNPTPTPVIVNMRDNCFIDPQDNTVLNGSTISFWLTSAPNGWTPNIRYSYAQSPVPGVNVNTCPTPGVPLSAQRGVRECEINANISQGSTLWFMTNFSRIIDGTTYICRFDSKWVKVLPGTTTQIVGPEAAPNNNPQTQCVNECRKWKNVRDPSPGSF